MDSSKHIVDPVLNVTGSWFTVGPIARNSPRTIDPDQGQRAQALRDANVTNAWGHDLYRLWLATNKGAPVLITELAMDL